MDVQGNIIRCRLEEREEALSSYAVKSKSSKGRLKSEPSCPVRTEFQRDRDRIVHCKAFRRLKHKTQVFIAPLGDHYVTRLTHTLEVSQIARTIARALNLNEDLTEAIALGHDLGHTPFGHVGEEVLNELAPFGFRHNEQSLRVIDLLEMDGMGLNLTWEVREGILNHSKPRTDILGKEWGTVETLEGQVCKIADIVAYVNHDIDDAIRSGLLIQSQLPSNDIAVLGESHSARINTMVCDIINYSQAALDEGTPTVGMSPPIQKASSVLRDFLFRTVYEPTSAIKMSDEARNVLRLLYYHFLNHTNELPQEYAIHADNHNRMVVDYVAGMTDQFALRMANAIQSNP